MSIYYPVFPKLKQYQTTDTLFFTFSFISISNNYGFLLTIWKSQLCIKIYEMYYILPTIYRFIYWEYYHHNIEDDVVRSPSGSLAHFSREISLKRPTVVLQWTRYLVPCSGVWWLEGSSLKQWESCLQSLHLIYRMVGGVCLFAVLVALGVWIQGLMLSG
jgi:hypothetical protein